MANVLDVSELDFDNIKGKLVEFMSKQAEFTDFDFTGSAINVLLDVLAYNTHYMGVYANMSLGESFMSSALLRNNIVRRAKELNYFPKQRTSASAIISLSITPPDNPPTLIIPKNTVFKSGEYTFVTVQDEPLTKSGLDFSGEFKIYEGSFINEAYSYSPDNRVYTLNNVGADVDHLNVVVGAAEWVFGNDNQLGDKTKEYYYLSEESDRYVGVYFGDNSVSKEPVAAETVSVEYLKCVGSAANNVQVFTMPAFVAGYSASICTLALVEKSTNGSDGNTIANIQLAAPKFYQAQGRAVTLEDYRAILYNKVAGLDSISLWAGEDNNPKRPGTVFISVKPSGVDILTPAQKDNILNILESYNVIGIIPIIVDPNIIYVNAVADVNYDKEKVISNTNITSVALNAVSGYFSDINDKFNSNLLYSKLLGAVDDSSADIINSNINYTVKQKTLLMNNAITVTLDFNNEIVKGSVLSTSWTALSSTFYIKDNVVTGKLELWRDDIYDSDVGTMDYINGIVSMNSINGHLDFNEIFIECSLVEDDVMIDRNYLLQLDSIEVLANGV